MWCTRTKLTFAKDFQKQQSCLNSLNSININAWIASVVNVEH